MKKAKFIEYLRDLADTVTNLAEELEETGEPNPITVYHMKVEPLNGYLEGNIELED